MRTYRPAGGENRALVWLHGGGWVIGSLDSHDPLCRALAARSQCSVVAVDYRLAPEHPHPAALEDVWAATQWATKTFDSVALGGDSAGAHLAAVVARRARDRQIRLALQVLVVPVTDYSFDTLSHNENGTGYGLERETMKWFWSLYVRDRASAYDPDVSPLRAIDLEDVAPALVLTAEYDPLRDEGEAYAARLRDARIPVEHGRYDGMVHGFLRMPAVLDRSRDAIHQWRVPSRTRSALKSRPRRDWRAIGVTRSVFACGDEHSWPESRPALSARIGHTACLIFDTSLAPMSGGRGSRVPREAPR